MTRAVGVALALAGCVAVTAPVPAPPASPAASVPEPVEEPPPVAEPAPRPTPPPKKAKPAPPPKKVKPTPEPYTLNDEQWKRARAVQRFVIAASAEHGVDPNLLNAVIWVESKFNPKARNNSGAKGLMQLMPKTGRAMAERLGRRHRPYDPEFSVHAGAKLLSTLLGKFEGKEKLALFGYARGGGRVRRWQREGGPIPEGVVKFIGRVERARFTFESLGFPESPQRP